MCNVCVDTARLDFSRWSTDQQRTARLAVLHAYAGEFEVGQNRQYRRGRDEQLGRDAEIYKEFVAERRASILAALQSADDQIRDGRDLGVVLRFLMTSVESDASRIPEILPR